MYGIHAYIYHTSQRIVVSKVVSTHVWNTPINLQQAMKGFLSLLARGIAWGVLYGRVVICLESQIDTILGSYRVWQINTI